MMQIHSPELKQAQQLAQTAQVLAIVALVGLVVTIVTKGGFILATTLVSDALSWRERVNQGGLILISLLPAFLLFEAVNRLRAALNHYSEGEFFSAAASSRVAQAGDYGLQAMIAMILIVPNLTMWIREGGGGFTIALEPSSIGMLAFTLFVSAVGRILTAATQLKAENDAFV